jgi:hypothetical protein
MKLRIKEIIKSKKLKIIIKIMWIKNKIIKIIKILNKIKKLCKDKKTDKKNKRVKIN